MTVNGVAAAITAGDQGLNNKASIGGVNGLSFSLNLTNGRTAAAAGSSTTINVLAGTYVETVVASKTVTLIGATTENPSFEVISPLLSRSRVYRLEALTPEDPGRPLCPTRGSFDDRVEIDGGARDLGR